MMKRIMSQAAVTAILIGLVFALARCTFDDRERCASYGFKPGTDGFANCLQREGDATARMLRSMPQPNIPAPMTCYPGYGGVMNCY